MSRGGCRDAIGAAGNASKGKMAFYFAEGVNPEVENVGSRCAIGRVIGLV